MRNFDCIFTPIVGCAVLPNEIINFYNDYQTPAWNAEKFGYINRGWCRIEMFYAANIPLSMDENRFNKLAHGLRHHTSNGVRPHVIYGDREADGRPPIVLSPLQNSYFDTLIPENGHVSVSSDKDKIKELVNKLKPFMKSLK